MLRQTRIQLAILSTIAVVAVTVMLFGYLRVQDAWGIGRMTVTAELPDGAGLYERSNVSYRGTTIGIVERLDLSGTGVRAVMRIEKGRDIPRDGLRVNVRSMSAIGEQFIDLVPTTAQGTRLANGDVLPLRDASVPTQVSTLLQQASALLDAISPGKLKTMVDAMFTAFDGTQADLVNLVDSLRLIADEAAKNPGTIDGLVAELGPFLRPHADSASAIATWSTQLARFTSSLAAGDQHIRRIIAQSPQATADAQQLLESISPTMPVLLANLISLGQVGVTYNAGLEQILVIMPGIIAGMQTMTNQGAKDQAATASFHTMSLPVCTTGYIPPNQRRHAGELSVPATPSGQYCSIPQDFPIAVRGARNLPCMEVPGKRAPTPEACRGGPYRPKGQYPSSIDGSGRADKQGLAGMLLPANYDPTTGAYIAPDGSAHRQLTITPATTKGASWKTLMLKTIG